MQMSHPDALASHLGIALLRQSCPARPIQPGGGEVSASSGGFCEHKWPLAPHYQLRVALQEKSSPLKAPAREGRPLDLKAGIC